MSLLQMIQVGGFTLYVLLICSVISLAIIVERCIYFHRKSRVRRQDLMKEVAQAIKDGNIKKAMDVCRRVKAPVSNVVFAGLNMHEHSENVISNTMERAVTIEMIKLERFTGIAGTIGSTAVYIGLFGTVLGIIRAFRDIATSGAGGINVVINGISEALICTAAGLCVAVPAVIAYNYFVRKIDIFVTDMELCASETMDLLAGKPKNEK